MRFESLSDAENSVAVSMKQTRTPVIARVLTSLLLKGTVGERMKKVNFYFARSLRCPL